MEDVGLFFFNLAEVQAVKARVAERVVVVAIFETCESRNSIDADAEQIMRISLEERQSLGIEFANFSEIVSVADLGQPSGLLLLRQSRKVIDFLRVNARDVATNRP